MLYGKKWWPWALTTARKKSPLCMVLLVLALLLLVQVVPKGTRGPGAKSKNSWMAGRGISILKVCFLLQPADASSGGKYGNRCFKELP